MGEQGEVDVVVGGTGLVGLLAALALARESFLVALVGPRPGGADLRTTAVMAGGVALLDRLGLTKALETQAAPLREMRIVDITGRLFRAPTATFKAREMGLDAFGWNIPNRVLADTLADALAREPGLIWHHARAERWQFDEAAATVDLSDGTTVRAKLAAAADGRSSIAREAAGIALRSGVLAQSAVVLTFAHTRDHNYVSTEFHTEHGPFTQVPLPGRRSSLVWVMRPAEAERMAALEDDALAQAVESKMQSMLGRVSVEQGRQIFPLASGTAERFAGRRVALLGEAGHVMPPIGAQGFNLGLRDVTDLVALVRLGRDDPGAPALLSRFDRARRTDVTSRGMAVGLLNRSLLSSFLPLQLARGAGLAALNAIGPLRTFVMREGLAPGSGLSGAIADLREGIGR